MIIIVDTAMGNLGSVLNMLHKLGVEARCSSQVAEIERATKLVLPGVGAFDEGMKSLHRSGLIEVLNYRVKQEKTPLLGICLGMQLLSQRSEEGTLPGLGWIDGETKRFVPSLSNEKIKVPHMGWNTIKAYRPSELVDSLGIEPRFYFVHSYHLVTEPENVLAYTEHGYEFPAIIQSDNIFGAQFHPEKSHRFGLNFLRYFAENV